MSLPKFTSEISDDGVKLIEAFIAAYTAGSGAATLDAFTFPALGKTFSVTPSFAVTAA